MIAGASNPSVPEQGYIHSASCACDLRFRIGIGSGFKEPSTLEPKSSPLHFLPILQYTRPNPVLVMKSPTPLSNRYRTPERKPLIMEPLKEPHSNHL